MVARQRGAQRGEHHRQIERSALSEQLELGRGRRVLRSDEEVRMDQLLTSQSHRIVVADLGEEDEGVGEGEGEGEC